MHADRAYSPPSTTIRFSPYLGELSVQPGLGSPWLSCDHGTAAASSGLRDAQRRPAPRSPPQDLPPSALGRGTAEGLSCRRSAVPHFGFVRET